MSKEILVKTLVTWFIFLFIAVINGAVRNFVYMDLVGELTAHQISTFLAITLFILLSVRVFNTSLANSNVKTLWIIGATWVLLTVSFEFIAGHYIFGNSWEKLIADYNILKGRLWLLMLITELGTPHIVRKFSQH